MAIENGNIGNAGNEQDLEFSEGNFLSAGKLDRAVILVNKVGIMNTKFGEKKYLSDGTNVVLVNKTMEKRFIELGYKNAYQLIGKTIYLNAVPVYVGSVLKKTWFVEKVE